jgi:hypothetical protein
MEISTTRDADNRSTRISGRVWDRDVLLDQQEIIKDIRWQITTKVADIVMEELEPAVREAIKNMKEGSK